MRQNRVKIEIAVRADHFERFIQFAALRREDRGHASQRGTHAAHNESFIEQNVKGKKYCEGFWCDFRFSIENACNLGHIEIAAVGLLDQKLSMITAGDIAIFGDFHFDGNLAFVEFCGHSFDDSQDNGLEAIAFGVIVENGGGGVESGAAERGGPHAGVDEGEVIV